MVVLFVLVADILLVLVRLIGFLHTEIYVQLHTTFTLLIADLAVS